MSWQPDFWIKNEDFYKLEDELKKYNVWEFGINEHLGFIISADEFTSTFEEIHEIIKDIPHWILNSEGPGCDNCITWGRQLYEYEDE